MDDRGTWRAPSLASVRIRSMLHNPQETGSDLEHPHGSGVSATTMADSRSTHGLSRWSGLGRAGSSTPPPRGDQLQSCCSPHPGMPQPGRLGNGQEEPPPSGRRGWASGTGGWEEALGPQAIPGPLGIKKLVSDGFPYLKNTGNGDYWVNIRILILKKRNSFQRHAGPRPTDSVDSNNKICPPRSAGAEERRPGHRGELRGPGPMLELS